MKCAQRLVSYNQYYGRNVVITYVEPEVTAGKTKVKVYLNRNGRRKDIVRYIYIKQLII